MWGSNVVKTVVDVGANNGSFTAESLRVFALDVCIAVEPDGTCASALRRRFASTREVIIHQEALASEGHPDRLPFSQGFGASNALISVRPGDVLSEKADPWDVRATVLREGTMGFAHTYVPVSTLDSTVLRLIPGQTVDFLKIDTEGMDLEVLKGANQLLEDGKIKFIQIEVGAFNQSTKFVNLEDAFEFLSYFGFALVRIYDQASVGGALRRSNALFSSLREKEAVLADIWAD